MTPPIAAGHVRQHAGCDLPSSGRVRRTTPGSVGRTGRRFLRSAIKTRTVSALQRPQCAALVLLLSVAAASMTENQEFRTPPCGLLTSRSGFQELGGLGAQPGRSNRPGPLWQLQDRSSGRLRQANSGLYWRRRRIVRRLFRMLRIPVSDRRTLGGLTQFGFSGSATGP